MRDKPAQAIYILALISGMLMLPFKRETGFEPATNGLEGRDSAIELLPRDSIIQEGFEKSRNIGPAFNKIPYAIERL